MDLLSRAVELAAKYHANQQDKAGQPYILHPLRVMLAQTGEFERMAAVLHDIVEDTPVSLSDLAQEFPEEVVAAVDALTKREGEAYQGYLNRVFENALARRVKRADLQDNLQRAYQTDVISDEKIKQYEAALHQLEQLE